MATGKNRTGMSSVAVALSNDSQTCRCYFTIRPLKRRPTCTLIIMVTSQRQGFPFLCTILCGSPPSQERWYCTDQDQSVGPHVFADWFPVPGVLCARCGTGGRLNPHPPFGQYTCDGPLNQHSDNPASAALPHTPRHDWPPGAAAQGKTLSVVSYDQVASPSPSAAW
jgi:hypothetical protein